LAERRGKPGNCIPRFLGTQNLKEKEICQILIQKLRLYKEMYSSILDIRRRQVKIVGNELNVNLYPNILAASPEKNRGGARGIINTNSTELKSS
jgi:hypothetical protein